MLKITKLNDFNPIYIELKNVIDETEEFEQTIIEKTGVDRVIISMIKLNITINNKTKSLYYVGVNRINEYGDTLHKLEYGGTAPIKEIAEKIYNKTIEEVKKDIIR